MPKPKLCYKTLNFWKKNFFPLYRILIRKPVVYFRFKNERKLLNGKKVSNSNEQSVLLFTTHKCASTFLIKFLKDIESVTNLVHINLDSYFSGKRLHEKNPLFSPDLLKKAYIPKGYIYGPIRSFRNIENLPKYRIILILRDPRDVLVSFYYSMAYSHGIIGEGVMQKRKEALSYDIDEYCIKIAKEFRKKYEDYLKLLGKKNVLFIKYEDMLGNPGSFISGVEEFLNISFTNDIKNRIKNEDLVVGKKEDIYSHRRSGKKGSYKEKLKPETVEKLNQTFAHVIKEFGFEK